MKNIARLPDGHRERRLLPDRRADFGETNAPAHRPRCGRLAGALTWLCHRPILAAATPIVLAVNNQKYTKLTKKTITRVTELQE